MKMRMSHARMSQLVALFGGDLRTYDLAAESTLLKAGFEMRVLWLFPDLTALGLQFRMEVLSFLFLLP